MLSKAVATILVAHAFAYLLVGALPKAGIAVLGIGAADPAALSRYQAQIDAPQSYGQAVYRLVTVNLGRTIDGTDVATALRTSLTGSIPLLLVSWGLIAIVVVIALVNPRLIAGPCTHRSFDFLAFVPAYVPGFVILALGVTTGSVMLLIDTPMRNLALGLAVGVTPACLAASTIANGYGLELQQRYVHFMRACGYDDDRIFTNIRRAVLLYAIPGWEKLFSLQIAVLIFTEAVFSYPGFGSLFLLSVQRTDVNLILAAVVCISTAVVSVRGLGSLVTMWLEPRDLEES